MKSVHKKRIATLPLPLRNKLRGTKRPFTVISEARPTLTPQTMPLLAKGMQDLAARGLRTFPYLNPRSLATLRPDDRELAPVSLVNEAMWVAAILALHSTSLNSHLKSTAQLEGLLLQGRFSEVLDQLDLLENAGAHSLGLIELRQAALQAQGGLSAQKEYLRKLRSERKEGDPLAYIAFHGSIRNEPTTQIFSFREHFSERIRTTTADEAFSAWLLFRICDEVSDHTDLASVLRSEQASPVSDWYDTFMYLATYVVAHDTPHALAFGYALPLLHGVVLDPRIDRMMSLLTTDSALIERLPLEIPSPLEGSPEQQPTLAFARKPSLQQLAYTIVNGFDEVEISPAPTDQLHPGIHDVVRAALISLASSDFDIQHFFTLMRLAATYRFTSIPSAFSLPAWRQVSSAMTTDSALLRTEYIASPYVSVRHIAVFSGDSLDALAKRFLQSNPDSYELYLELVGLGLDERFYAGHQLASFHSLPNFAIGTAKLRRQVDLEQWHQSEVMARELLQCEHPSVRRNASRALVGSLLKQDKVLEAVEFTVPATLGDDTLSYVLPIPEIVAKLGKSLL